MFWVRCNNFPDDRSKSGRTWNIATTVGTNWRFHPNNNTAKQQVCSGPNEYSPVLFNICVFQTHCHTVVREFLWASHCCIPNESVLGERLFNRVAPPLLSFVAIRDSRNEVKPAALDVFTIIPLFIYLDSLDTMFLQGNVFQKFPTPFHLFLLWLSCWSPAWLLMDAQANQTRGQTFFRCVIVSRHPHRGKLLAVSVISNMRHVTSSCSCQYWAFLLQWTCQS